MVSLNTTKPIQDLNSLAVLQEVNSVLSAPMLKGLDDRVCPADFVVDIQSRKLDERPNGLPIPLSVSGVLSRRWD